LRRIDCKAIGTINEKHLGTGCTRARPKVLISQKLRQTGCPPRKTTRRRRDGSRTAKLELKPENIVFGRKDKELTMAERRKKTPSRKTPRKTAGRTKAASKAATKRWSQRVTQQSDALDLKRGVFKLTSAKKIASSLKRSAEQSSRRKAGAYRSALSMLTFYINRAGSGLSATRRRTLEAAKGELRKLFGKDKNARIA
jgi:hypothetical protein